MIDFCVFQKFSDKSRHIYNNNNKADSETSPSYKQHNVVVYIAWQHATATHLGAYSPESQYLREEEKEKCKGKLIPTSKSYTR